MTSIQSIITFVISILLVLTVNLFMPLILDGISRNIRAILQFREGPKTILQTLYDISSLLDMDSNSPTNRLGFILAPYLAFASIIIASLILPYGSFTIVSFSGDIFVFLYTIAMVSISMIITGFIVNNPYANIGANREAMLILTIEPVLGIGIASLALKTYSLSITGIISGLTPTISLILVYVVLAYAVYVECGFVPFDIAEAETEILEGPLVEYSGRLLGLFKWALLIKRFVLIWFFSSLLILPFVGYTPLILSPWKGLLVFLLQLLTSILVYCTYIMVEAFNARLRIDQIFKLNIKIFLLGLIAFIITAMGW